MFSLLKCVSYFIIGSIAGVSMGTIGMGAGSITVPLLLYTGLTIPQSIAVIMVMQLLPQSLPGVYNYRKHIIWEPTILVIIGSLFGIWFGSHMVAKEYISEKMQYRMMTVFLFISSIYFYIKHWN